MSEEQLNELKWRYPFEEQWEHCYFDDKGNLWTPRIIDDVMVKTGEEVYLEELNKPIPQVEQDKIDILNAKIAFIDSYKHEARLYFDYGNCGGEQRFANEDILFINLTIDGMKAGLTPTVKWKYSNGEYDIVTDVTYFETMKFIGGSLISKAFEVEEIIINELKLLDSIEELLAYDEKARFDELFSIA